MVLAEGGRGGGEAGEREENEGWRQKNEGGKKEEHRATVRDHILSSARAPYTVD